jgi:hypothetical protein
MGTIMGNCFLLALKPGSASIQTFVMYQIKKLSAFVILSLSKDVEGGLKPELHRFR